MKKKLLIFGAGETAAIASEFKYDSDEELAGYIVDDNYWKKIKFLIICQYFH